MLTRQKDHNSQIVWQKNETNHMKLTKKTKIKISITELKKKLDINNIAIKYRRQLKP